MAAPLTRPAPVMKATLPSTLPDIYMVLLSGSRAAVSPGARARMVLANLPRLRSQCGQPRYAMKAQVELVCQRRARLDHYRPGATAAPNRPICLVLGMVMMKRWLTPVPLSRARPIVSLPPLAQ